MTKEKKTTREMIEDLTVSREKSEEAHKTAAEMDQELAERLDKMEDKVEKSFQGIRDEVASLKSEMELRSPKEEEPPEEKPPEEKPEEEAPEEEPPAEEPKKKPKVRETTYV